MAPPDERTRAAVQSEAWRRLWAILLAPRPDDDDGHRHGDAATDEVAASNGEVRDDAAVTPRSSP